MRTVATYPNTIFVLSALAVALAFIFLCFVRLPKSEPEDEEAQLAESVADAIEEPLIVGAEPSTS